MSHANACLTPRGRLRLARCVVDDGWTYARAAERFQCSTATTKKWADRYRAGGPEAMVDRSSRPHRSPGRLSQRRERRIIKVRFTRRWGPHRIAAYLRLARSTVEAVLRRYRMPLLRHLDQASGLPVRRAKPRRYEHPHPGTWSTSTSRSWAASPTVAGTANWDGKPVDVTAAVWGMRFCTMPSMIIRGWPTPRSSPTNAKTPQPGSGCGLTGFSSITGSPSGVC